MNAEANGLVGLVCLSALSNAFANISLSELEDDDEKTRNSNRLFYVPAIEHVESLAEREFLTRLILSETQTEADARIKAAMPFSN